SNKFVGAGRTLNNAAAATWSGGGLFVDGTFHNLAGASFDDQIDSVISPNSGGGAQTFTNDGTFTKSAATGTTTISSAFNTLNSRNRATINSRTLRLTGPGTPSATGSFSVTTGTALDFGNNYTLSAGSSVSSPLVIFSNGTVALNGTYAVTNETRATGGTANF